MKRLSRSNQNRLIVMCVVVTALLLTYEVTTFDMLPWGGLPGAMNPSAPVAGARLDFSATAYCKGTTTASGATVRTGIAAADDSILPVGSVVNVTTDNARYNGVYTIMDTGPRVQGRLLDLYMWSCKEALTFGRKPIQVTVLRLGWNPQASTPSLVDRLFRRRERARAEVPPPADPPPAAIEPAVEETTGSEQGEPQPPSLPAAHDSSSLSVDQTSSPAPAP
jgi:3D (Asp-Asp-Asp) domain-containing protein